MKTLLAVNIGSDTPLAPGVNLGGAYPDAGVLISSIIRNSIAVISVLLVVLLILGGINYIISAGSGDPKKAAQAQALITDALIGFAVVFLAYFIIQIVEVITGMRILNSGL